MFGKKTFGKIMILLTVFVLLLSTFSSAASAKNSPEDDKHSAVISSETISKSYDIAVAYDNSGSMYMSDMKGAWYQAKYAMEIFASMMDLDGGDKLTVFPMWPVTTDGNKNSSQTTRIDVRSVKDIDKIHNMFSPVAGGTPFTPVTSAESYLKGSKADERWLIVLTDGVIDVADLQGKLEKVAKGKIKVQYLPLGEKSVELKSKPNQNFYASSQANGEEQLQKSLIEACNRIFQRDVLEGALSKKTLTLDLSMKKVIVFVQGNGASVTSLKDSNGKEIKKIVDSGKRSYSNLGAGTINGTFYPLPDKLKNQSGQVVTFDACPKGTYTLEYSNADNIQIFYEPDVTMVIDFVNSDGLVEDFSDGNVIAGEYKYSAKIIDNKTGEDVTNHKLMGGKVDIDGKVKYPGKTANTLKNGDSVTFEPGEKVDFDITATYLGKYKLSTKDDKSIDWSKITIDPPEGVLTVKADVQQPNSWYSLKDHKNWKPIRIDLALDGEPLTDEQLNKAEIEFKLEDNEQKLAYHTENLPGESAINLYIATDPDGKYVKPKTGSYDSKITVTVPDEYNEPTTNKPPAEASFKIKNHSFFWEILKWILIALAILFAIAAWLIHPVLPKQIFITDATGYVQAATVSKSFSIKCSEDRAQVALSGKAKVIFSSENFWISSILNPTRQSFTLTDVNAANLSRIEVGSTQGFKNGNSLVTSTGNEIKNIKFRRGDISWIENSGLKPKNFSGSIRVNRNQ